MKWPRSLFERFEEWLFKIRRKDPFKISKAAIDEARKFKEFIAQQPCPACKSKLIVSKFERGPKGWEADIECEGCNFKAVTSSLSSVLLAVHSLGKARER